MCLAVPGLVKKISNFEALVDFGGVTRPVNSTLTPGLTAGDYVLVHAGCSISIIDQHEARETLKLLEQLAATDEAS